MLKKFYFTVNNILFPHFLFSVFFYFDDIDKKIIGIFYINIFCQKNECIKLGILSSIIFKDIIKIYFNYLIILETVVEYTIFII